MYTALILIVFSASTPAMLTDTRGPYDSEADCQARVEEMKTYIYAKMSKYSITEIKGKCRQDGTAL